MLSASQRIKMLLNQNLRKNQVPYQKRELNPEKKVIPPPLKELPGVPDAKPAKPKTPKQGGKSGKRKRWKDSEGNIYEWDYQHGDVEKYDKRGKHLGSIDPKTGNQTLPPPSKWT